MENKEIVFKPDKSPSADAGKNSYECFLDGNRDAFSFIIQEYKNPLMLYINTLVGNIHTAEELTQETFVQIGLKKPRFNGKSSFKTFLFAIGRNVTLNHLRKAARERTVSIEDFRELSEDERSIEKEYLKQEDKVLIHRAMNRLLPQYRQILWLTYFEGLSNKEAAGVMKKTKHSIETLKYRAEKALKTQLEKEGFIYENR